MSLAIIYGSSTGNTKDAAELIAEELGGEADLFDVASVDPKSINEYDKLILGTSTWGSGELQDDWDVFDWSDVDLSGKTVALFGLGDQESYADEFCNALKLLYDEVESKGGNIVGSWPSEGYEFEESESVNDAGDFLGLVLDEDNESDQTPQRVKSWVEKIRADFS